MAKTNCVSNYDKFTYIWKITNLWYSTLQTGECINSPDFCVPQFKNTTWYLKLYPQGETKKCENNVSCFIRRTDDDSGPETLEMKYNIIFSSENSTFLYTRTFKKNNGWGFDKFLTCCHKDYDCYQKSLVISIELQICEVCNFCNVLDFSSTLKYSDGELTGSKENQTDLCCKKKFTFPVKCLVETKIAYDTFNVQLPLNLLINGTSSKETVPLNLPEKYPSLIIDLLCDSDNHIGIKISLVDPLIEKSLLATCKLGVSTNKVGAISHLFEEKHLFTLENKLETWSLMEKIETSKYGSQSQDFPMEGLNLRMDFVFSYGEFDSKILNIQYINTSHSTLFGKELIISKEIFKFYKQKKLCDAVLKIGNKTFDVHKVVLCTASPVFAAMFTNEMTEKKTNVVDITDLDEDTVEELISFIYTGSLKEFEFENAQKLFIAGDKYQIFSLMNLCRNDMISRISCQNLYEILAIADTHNDIKLEKEAVKFIKLNKNIILSSTEWDQFAEKNARFAENILRKVCLLNIRNV